MESSKNLKRKIRNNLIIVLSCIALFLGTLAIFKLADFSVDQKPALVNNSQAVVNRLENTDTTTYIYDAADLVAFRDAVNAGDPHNGKTVYLMDDIDLSTVCSSQLGSWVPIGTTTTYFRGTFEGNYHTIKNIYMNTANYQYLGLFHITGTVTVIQNLNMENISIYNKYNTKSSYTGGIAGFNYGIIQNCSINNGSISNYHTAIGTSSSVLISCVGGITGSHNRGTIKNCYNNVEVLANSNTSSSYVNARAGGIAAQSNENAIILNCYNKASVAAKGYTFSCGGLVGSNFGGSVVENSYNYGSVTGTGSGTKYIGGIVGRNAAGYTGSITTGTISNSYCTTGTTYSYYYYSSSYKTSTTGRVTAANLKTYTVTLGNAFAYDVYGINNGYPVLAWENRRPVMELNKNQAYIKIGENLQLNVLEKTEITEIIGDNYLNSNFKWVSTNEDVAKVDENGLVTGLEDGYTTIYAYHETEKLYAMAIINVSKDFATPQIETGNGYTVILKSNGTVWTLGNNTDGQLGNGTTDNSKVPVQVKIDEDTNLENIIKISSGTDHIVALTNDGKVYAWGANSYGQLGQNNTENSKYAKLVLGVDGLSFINNIVDISASAWGTVLLNKNGDVYVFGQGTYGEMENNTKESSSIPIKTSLENAIQVSIGQGTVGVLTSDGVVWAWGVNSNGELGINCTKNTSYSMKVALNVTDLSVGGYHIAVKKINSDIYTVGCYSSGRLATDSTANQTVYKKANLPSTISENNKVKYIKAGRMNTTILLQDGTVWSVGYGISGELGNGKNANSSTFVKGSISNGILENILVIGNNKGDSLGSSTAGYGLNTAVIAKDGEIYITGDNKYGQIGDNTNINKSYYTKMGYAYLEYDDKIVEAEEYQIELDKLQYRFSSINAFNNEKNFELGEIKYTSLNPNIVIVNESGKVIAQPGASGIGKIKIEDLTNGYETDFTIVVNKLENTDKITYIYNAEELVKFRNAVNSGNSYSGKTVYLMADIDMSTICSEKLGSWKPIGTNETYFSGTFDGNYHTISNLYISSNNYRYLGLFYITRSTSIIRNVLLENINIYNNYNITHSYTGGIAGWNYGIILNSGIISGSIRASETVIGTSTSSIICAAGGIVGTNLGTINSCYNNANILATSNDSSSYGQARAGGIAGQSSTQVIINCYNRGKISSKGRYISTGGVIGVLYDNGSVKNCYNYGEIIGEGTNNYFGGILGRNGAGYEGSQTKGTISNCYCTTETAYSYHDYIAEKNKTDGRVIAANLKTYTTKLGKTYVNDSLNINNGYPILWWQAPTVELNKKQEYIKLGDTINLSIIQNEAVAKVFGGEVDVSSFAWTSTNPEIATVNENGLVTGVAEGSTTIYGYNAEKAIYTMCIINVYAEQANPQVESGEGFTAILKADGTVWTVGKNENGELGDGSNEEKIEAVQVKINENTPLTNIVKISVGTSHVLALTNDGKVYTWGANSYGQLGLNNKENSNYAKLVLGEGGSSNLNRIIDISAGNYGSSAVNQFGWVFVWGNGTYGEMANGTTNSNLTPTKTTLNTAITSSIGAGHVIALGQNGNGYTWGRNTYGELGVGNTTNSTTVNKVLEAITEVSAAGYETVAKKVDGNIAVVGLNTDGQLGNGTVTNATSFTTITLPTAVTAMNKVKYIKAGRTSTSLLLTDGSVYVSGKYGAEENTKNFVQAQAKSGNLENILSLGRSSGESLSLNTAAVNKNGRIYTIGSNQYGQIGDNSKEDVTYFKEMGYIEVLYPEEIVMNVNEERILTGDDFAYIEKYMNVYVEDTTKVPLLTAGKILDSNIAIYEKGKITAKNIGKTVLMAEEPETGTLMYIPVTVVPENGLAIPDLKTGNNFTITLKSNGTVWSFGNNEYGQLGLGHNNSQNVPKQVELLSDKIVSQIEVGNNHVIVLTKDGEVYTWGLNSDGQLGTNNIRNSNIPQKVQMPQSEELVKVIEDTIVKVIANKNTSYAIAQSGKVYAWGESYTNKPTLLETELDIVDISNNYILDIEGNVYNKQTNTRLEIVEKIKYISEGRTHTVFLSEIGTGFAIGSNTFGQFGDGTNVSNETQVVAIRNEDLTDILRGIVKLEAGDGYTVALLENGKLVEFGSNQYGQLGTDEIGETNKIRENTSVTKLLSEKNQNIILTDAGKSHVAIALSDGNVYTWGTGINGELGNGINDDKIEVQLVGKNIVETNENNLLLNVNENFDLQANTTYFNLMQDINGEISYESKDQSVAIVDSTTGTVTGISQGKTVIVVRENGTNNISLVQVRVLPEGIEIEPQVSTNGSHTVTLKVDGTVWCYGNNTNGELGNDTKQYSDEPVQAIFEEGTTIVQIAAGENFSVALDSEGNVWTWGANDYYQLGNSSVTNQLVPTKVEGLSNITKIAVGTYSVLAIDNNKELYGWGLNSNGELGIGSFTNKVSKPTKAKYMSDVIDIAVGKNHSILLKSTGEVFVTGLNIYGQLGNNDTNIKKVELFTKVENLNSIARITATDSGNIVSTINGNVYSWGLNIYGELGLGDKTNKYIPTLVDSVENIVEVSGGKNHSVLLDSNGKIYTTGSNKYGYLGNGTKTENLNYVQVQNMTDVMTISAGNTYTVIAKEDGTVWGFGDYNHGDKTLKSKTNSATPMQVGNDTFGLGVIEVTIKKSETIGITSYLEYSFNLIHLDKNNTEKVTYESVNEEIVAVNEYGEILGVREGFTWIKAIEEDGTEHVVYVYVTDNEAEYAPKITAGEDFSAVLKADGSIWTFGHNNNGELGIGSNRTKDIPEKTNVILTYKQINSGESFTTALRSDGTVWSYGENNYGQLGIGSTKNGLNPVQVNGLFDIVQIATGKDHNLALDSLGILYGWGKNTNGQLGLTDEKVLLPTPISYTQGTISSIWAGENQSIIINTKGEIFGYGSLLNGKLESINNAVKVQIGNGYMLILDTAGNVYKYDGNRLTKILEEIVDIDVTNNNNIAQTKTEKVYTWVNGENPKLSSDENVYTIASGTNNNYIIKSDGTVFAKGTNQYGQLGNSTRIDSLEEFTLVGDREFTVEPDSKIMYVNDIEQLTEQIVVNEFNVFNKSIRNGEEYTWTTSDENVVAVENGELKANSEGTAEIIIKDNITNAEFAVTRVVIPVEKDRLENISVNAYDAKVIEEYKYYVEVQTNNDIGTLNITTKDKTDKISIDNGTTWFENGSLISDIDITNEDTELDILVETSNGTQISYALQIKKISTDVSLKNITVDGIEAIPTSNINYEVVVSENTNTSEISAIANEKAKVSINGEDYINWKSIATIDYIEGSPITVPIIVQAENGDELEYTLTIYKESAILQLESLIVNEKEAEKTSEGVYSAIIPRNLANIEVTAKAVSELVNISLNNEASDVQISTKQVKITDEITEVQIRLSTVVNGGEVYKDYILNIYKKAESGKLEFVIVNGTVVMPNINGDYEAYLPAETVNATVKVIAENELDYVQIGTAEKQLASIETQVSTPNDSNNYSIIVTDEDLETSESYLLYIKKPSVDTSLKEITISNGNDKVVASKSYEEENVYIAKVKGYDEYNIKAITNSTIASVGIDGEEKTKNIATKAISKTADSMEVEIQVESENGDIKDYLLKIYIKESDTSLEYIKVNEILATLQTDGSYLVNLDTPETEVSVNAKATSSKSSVKIQDEEYELNQTTKNITIDSKETISYIFVKAEDGSLAKYKLVITGLPDDATLDKVNVNGIEAKYLEGQNKYEIRLDSEIFEVEAIATDSLAKVALNDGEEAVASKKITVTKAGSITTVKINVAAQNGIDSREYTLEIKERSNDASIGNVKVEGKTVRKDADGNYVAEVVKNTEVAEVTVETNDLYAIVYLDDVTKNSNSITETKQITDRESEHTITVKAEDGTEESHTLTIIRLEDNANIQELTLTLNIEELKEVVDETTGEVTEEIKVVEKTYNLEPDENGNYYLKMDRVEKVDIKAVLEDPNAKVKIKNSEYVLSENEVTVDTVDEKSEIIVSVAAEDGTIKNNKLILEKKSNDTTIKTIASDDMLKKEEFTIYVDESLNEIDLTLATNSDLSSIKLETDTGYMTIEITRTIDLSDAALPEGNESEGWPVNVEVLAEDGTVGKYTITVVKIGNTNIDSVKVNDEIIENKNNTYTKKVNVSDSATVEITPNNANSKVEIIKTVEDAEGGFTETIISSAVGTLTTEVPLNESPENYSIRITSEKGSTITDYNLVITQKSTDVSLSYVKVDGITTIKTDDGYKSVVSGKENYPVVIKTTNENAQVKLAYKDYVGEYAKGKLEENVLVAEDETLEVTAIVLSENGDEQSYKLFISRISNDTALDYVKVDEEFVTEFNEATNTYRITVSNQLVSSQLEVKTHSDKSKIIIGSTEGTAEITNRITLDGEGTTKKVTIKVEAEDGTIKEYYLEIIQLSAKISLQKITVNNKKAQRKDFTNYEITISNETGLAEVKVVAQDSLSTVSIAGEVSILSEATKTYTLNGIETIQTTIAVTAEDGITTEEYTLTIYVKDANNNIEYVKVNTGVIEPEGNIYNVFIEETAITANVEIKAESQYATIEITNKSDLTIQNENLNLGVLNFAVETPENVTIINYSITSQLGETKEYTIVLTKISTDNTLKELYVGNELVEASEDGNYYMDIENPSELNIKAIANSEFANIRIDYNDEQKQQTEAIVNIDDFDNKVTITITSQAGVTARYYLNIRVLANNPNIDKVIVDSTEITNYDEQNKVYTAIVDNTKDSYEVFLMAVNDGTTIELYDGEELIASGVGNITDIVTLQVAEEGHEYKIKSSLDDGNSSEYTLRIIRMSNNINLNLVEVNDVPRAPTEIGGFVYEVNIEKLATSAKIKVKTANSFATVKIGDNDTVVNEDTITVNLNLAEDRTTVPAVVTAVDGTTIATYNILLLRQSNNANLESVVVNEQVIPNVENVYTYEMKVDEFNAHTEIAMKLDDNATIQVDDKTGVGYLELDIPFEATTIKVEKTIKVTSEDGSNQKEYKLVLFKPTKLAGTITTQNYEFKHISNISLYKAGEENPIETLTTNEDGTFEIEILEAVEYELRVEKLGYLNKVIKGITIVPGIVNDLGKYEIFAGDVVKTEEIEIDDLVAITDKFGTTIEVLEGEENENAIFDLNEDGIVNKLDIDILKLNYGKKSETIQWENPNKLPNLNLTNSVNVIYTGYKQNQTQIVKQDFILPISCDYKITSQYGTRIHPVTGEEKKHTGLDISGTHHTEIYSIADGEVTFAGVQNGFGNCIEIKHVVNGETIYSFYAHLSRIDVEAGQTVTQGQTIGLEGGDPTLDPNPGSSTGHHLHFEIRKATGYGNDINPMDYIKF